MKQIKSILKCNNNRCFNFFDFFGVTSISLAHDDNNNHIDDAAVASDDDDDDER